MSELAFIVLPLLVGFGLLYWSSILEEAAVLKFMLRLFFLPCVLIACQFGLIFARISYEADTELVELLADYVYYFSLLIYAIGLYYLFKIVGAVVDIIQKKKRDNEEELYG